MVDSFRFTAHVDEHAPNVRVLARDEFGTPTAFAVVPLIEAPDCGPLAKLRRTRHPRPGDWSGWVELGYTTDDGTGGFPWR